MKKENFKERQKRARANPYLQRKIYRNKIAIPIFLALCLILYPIEIFLRNIFDYDPYIGGFVLIAITFTIGMGIGELKTIKEFDEKKDD